jgi:hypothetical protein
MPTDTSLVKACLRSLANNSGRGLTTEELIGLDVETSLGRPLTAQQIRGALVECRDRGWAMEETDTWGQPSWLITASGALARKEI